MRTKEKRVPEAAEKKKSAGGAPSRVIVEGVEPEIDCGALPVKRVVGDTVVVSADVHADGHDRLGAVLRWRRAGAAEWSEAPMRELGNDRFEGDFTVTDVGRYEYGVLAWIDRFASWRRDLEKKTKAGQDVRVDLADGAALVSEAAQRAGGADGKTLERSARAILEGAAESRVASALDRALLETMTRHSDRRGGCNYGKTLAVVVERPLARFGAWYEMFPRSASPDPKRPGTLRDVEALLPYVASMNFDVLYLPPIHPIGVSHRKGPNNSVKCSPGDPGSPWAIGAKEGGHKEIHPALGTIEDFRKLVASAKKRGIEIALDIAFQCSPDHPYVREHPEWFRKRSDGTIKYAENPPKKYQDIYPIDFECEDWPALWNELRDVILHWVKEGVTVFRVDNPHTKPFRFWQWLIGEVKERHPETIFLSEAFTRPKVMQFLAKAGFSQSYSYFTWRNTRREIETYFRELTQTKVREYLRPNLFANTPDILHEYLQFGGRAAFAIRLVLASTLGASYGIYGPPFELAVGRAVPGSEEYQDSEKYEVRHWNRDDPASLRDVIARINAIRRDNPALHSDWSLRFHPVDNDKIVFYSKATSDLSNIVFVIASVDPHHVQTGNVRVPVAEFGLEGPEGYQVHDLVSDARWLWHGDRNTVVLDPETFPAHILRVRRKVKTERDFDYYM